MRTYKFSKLNIKIFKYFFISNKFELIGRSGAAVYKIFSNGEKFLYNNSKVEFFFPNRSFSQNLFKSFNRLIAGLNFGYFAELSLRGVGFKVYFLNVNKVLLNLGYSHYIVYDLPFNVISFIKKGKIFLYSMDSSVLGKAVSDLKNFRIADPYRAKGIIQNSQMFSLKEGKKR
jgi:ribosomal protein L6P/L9E